MSGKPYQTQKDDVVVAVFNVNPSITHRELSDLLSEYHPDIILDPRYNIKTGLVSCQIIFKTATSRDVFVQKTDNTTIYKKRLQVSKGETHTHYNVAKLNYQGIAMSDEQTIRALCKPYNPDDIKMETHKDGDLKENKFTLIFKNKDNATDFIKNATESQFGETAKIVQISPREIKTKNNTNKCFICQKEGHTNKMCPTKIMEKITKKKEEETKKEKEKEKEEKLRKQIEKQSAEKRENGRKKMFRKYKTDYDDQEKIKEKIRKMDF
ncbi:hypothetical protein EIN_165640 [Entamoeba invadens IP1]|uniref:CCHC-type domain-containing protein n=1 Tax=Entamoeba invadens IP1 TaxID=370355 RepID=A0A0A1UBL1_ENTIV|nr:hypothetical protein EIN_165640 [Entamoeba invadens IP1]ELP92599.1 hypothetical protein EIN_165640 [Entamoeba invadens IP1]|eukprot:XP_004259370.1 hypothetical protein EIN_165640 [Entamoeba invadens IP1]